MSDMLEDALRNKQKLRQSIAARRENLPDADSLSRRIWDRLLALPEFVSTQVVMTYLDFGSEVRTREHVPAMWQMGKKVVVPYCVGDELRLFHLQNMDELAEGTWSILEPKPEWRLRADRNMDATELDLILVPGLAFDRNGGRLGFGKGYYDHFLGHVRPDALKIALAFECQLVENIPALEHDVRMDMVITENGAYRGA
jgi:5-formyltetrahydrofolate cyclo-ligase